MMMFSCSPPSIDSKHCQIIHDEETSTTCIICEKSIIHIYVGSKLAHVLQFIPHNQILTHVQMIKSNSNHKQVELFVCNQLVQVYYCDLLTEEKIQSSSAAFAQQSDSLILDINSPTEDFKKRKNDIELPKSKKSKVADGGTDISYSINISQQEFGILTL